MSNNFSENKIHPSLLKRKIIHIDLDAFYAAVEIRDNPLLKGKPVIIGGLPQERSVVCTCSYEARKFGIRSAMSSAMAKKLCPQAIFIRPQFEKYKKASQIIFQILQKYCSTIEPMSLDEAYLDVTIEARESSATAIAQSIRNEIFLNTQLTASAGIAPNKMIAKIASDINKPNGLTIIKPKDCFIFMQDLPLKKIPFIGPVTAQKFATHQLLTCKNVIQAGKDYILEHFGESAIWVWEKAQGIDESDVCTTHIRKSFGEEETFPKDLTNNSEIIAELNRIVKNLYLILERKNIAFKTISIKIKYNNFQVKTKAKSFPLYFSDLYSMEKISHSLFLEMEKTTLPIRLLGVSVSNVISKNEMQQVTLFPDYI